MTNDKSSETSLKIALETNDAVDEWLGSWGEPADASNNSLQDILEAERLLSESIDEDQPSEKTEVLNMKDFANTDDKKIAPRSKSADKLPNPTYKDYSDGPSKTAEFAALLSSTDEFMAECEADTSAAKVREHAKPSTHEDMPHLDEIDIAHEATQILKASDVAREDTQVLNASDISHDETQVLNASDISHDETQVLNASDISHDETHNEETQVTAAPKNDNAPKHGENAHETATTKAEKTTPSTNASTPKEAKTTPSKSDIKAQLLPSTSSLGKPSTPPPLPKRNTLGNIAPLPPIKPTNSDAKPIGKPANISEKSKTPETPLATKPISEAKLPKVDTEPALTPNVSTISNDLGIEDLIEDFEDDVARARGPQPKKLLVSDTPSANDIEEPENEIPLVDASLDLKPQLLEIRSHLTNLTSKNVAQRAEWLQLDTIKLPSRIKVCTHIFDIIEQNHERNHKLFVTIKANPGMGKTAFLSELYGLLTHSPNDIVTIAPAQSKSKRPFASIRNLIAQRLYITGSDSNTVFNQLDGALHSMISSKDTAERTFEKLKELWQLSKQPRDEQDTRPLSKVVEPFINAVQALIASDLKRNRLVILFDDVEKYDPESIALLAKVFESLLDGAFTLVVTHNADTELPESLRSLPTKEYILQSMSDEDLTWFSKKLLEQMSQSREKLIVPPELCLTVAQHACGSPKRALDTMIRDFCPDKMMLWNENLESLKREEVPEDLRIKLKKRFLALPQLERAVIAVASILNAPFTAQTIDAITYDPSSTTRVENAPHLKHLLKLGFLSISATPLLQNSTTYVFKHEYERMAIASVVNQDIRERVYGSAAQWYALNNPDGRFNETIGTLWHEQHNDIEASHYFERVAYIEMSRANLVKARRMFKRLLETLPSNNVARRIQVALDASRVSLRLGNVTESLRLARSAWRHANRLSAFSMAGAATLQIAEIHILMGAFKHAYQYIKKARRLINLSMIPTSMLKTYALEIRLLIYKSNYQRAATVAAKARKFANLHKLTEAETAELKLCEADVIAACGKPKLALEYYKDIIKTAEHNRLHLIFAEAYQALGSLQFRLGERAGALDSWNKALGLAQEMNDVFLHTSLLSDISEGAIELKAMRTARATSEQCLSLAQQLGHKYFIAKCLVNHAEIQFRQNHFSKADRTLRKASIIASNLGQMSLVLRINTLKACCAASEITNNSSQDSNITHVYAPRISELLLNRVSKSYATRGMKMDVALMQTIIADFYIHTKQNIQALNAYRLAHSIYNDLQMPNALRTTELLIGQLYRETDVAHAGEYPAIED